MIKDTKWGQFVNPDGTGGPCGCACPCWCACGNPDAWDSIAGTAMDAVADFDCTQVAGV